MSDLVDIRDVARRLIADVDQFCAEIRGANDKEGAVSRAAGMLATVEALHDRLTVLAVGRPDLQPARDDVQRASAQLVRVLEGVE